MYMYINMYVICISPFNNKIRKQGYFSAYILIPEQYADSQIHYKIAKFQQKLISSWPIEFQQNM